MKRVLPKYDDGKPTNVGGYRVYPSAVGASELNVTSPDINVVGINRRPLYQRYNAENSTFDPNATTNFTGLLPIVGDVEQGIQTVDAARQGNFGQAAALGASMIAPPIVRKSPIGRFFGNLFGGIGRFFSNLFSSKYKRRMLRNRITEGANDVLSGVVGGTAGAYGSNQVTDGDETATGLGGAGGFIAGMAGRRGLKNLRSNYKIDPRITDPLIHPVETAIETARGNYPWTHSQQQRIFDKNLQNMTDAIDGFFPQRTAVGEYKLPKVNLNVRGSNEYMYGQAGHYDPTTPNPTIRINGTISEDSNLPAGWQYDPVEGTAIHEYNHHIQRNNNGLRYTKESEGYTQDGLHYKNPHAFDENSPVADEARILFTNGQSWESSVDEFDSELSNYLYEDGLGYASYPSNVIIERLAKRFNVPLDGARRLADAIINNRVKQLPNNGVRMIDNVVNQ